MDRDLDATMGGGRAAKLAAAGQSHDRAEACRLGGSLHDVGAGERGDEDARWIGQQIRRRAQLHHLAPVEHTDAVGQDRGVFERMRDEQGREPQSVQRVTKLVADLLARNSIERAERFVEEQHSRLAGERAREGHALALAAGKLSRQDSREMRDTEAFEQVRTLAPACKCHVGGDGEMREQSVVLGQVANTTTLGADVNPARCVEPHLIA